VEIKFEIDENYIKRMVEDGIVESALNEYSNKIEIKHGIRNGTDKAIKEYIYTEKENIINRVVERVTTEIVKKGLPKLLENLGK
jgi:uncharacterized protein with FMN-binding domain